MDKVTSLPALPGFLSLNDGNGKRSGVVLDEKEIKTTPYQNSYKANGLEHLALCSFPTFSHFYAVMGCQILVKYKNTWL